MSPIEKDQRYWFAKCLFSAAILLRPGPASHPSPKELSAVLEGTKVEGPGCATGPGSQGVLIFGRGPKGDTIGAAGFDAPPDCRRIRFQAVVERSGADELVTFCAVIGAQLDTRSAACAEQAYKGDLPAGTSVTVTMVEAPAVGESQYAQLITQRLNGSVIGYTVIYAAQQGRGYAYIVRTQALSGAATLAPPDLGTTSALLTKIVDRLRSKV